MNRWIALALVHLALFAPFTALRLAHIQPHSVAHRAAPDATTGGTR